MNQLVNFNITFLKNCKNFEIYHIIINQPKSNFKDYMKIIKDYAKIKDAY